MIFSSDSKEVVSSMGRDVYDVLTRQVAESPAFFNFTTRDSISGAIILLARKNAKDGLHGVLQFPDLSDLCEPRWVYLSVICVWFTSHLSMFFLQLKYELNRIAKTNSKRANSCCKCKSDNQSVGRRLIKRRAVSCIFTRWNFKLFWIYNSLYSQFFTPRHF